MASVGTVFVAGATGAVGRALCRLLVSAGYSVFGMTRKKERTTFLEDLSVEPVLVDVYDGGGLAWNLKKIRPRVVFHQLTDLPFGLPEDKMGQGRINNDKIRDVGTKNLVAASREAGIRRMVAQSLCFLYGPGPKPLPETTPLVAPGLSSHENQILTAPFESVVLRYGYFWGPHTGFDKPGKEPSLHVESAAWAACLAVYQGRPGVYNIADDDAEVSLAKARTELKWHPGLRLSPPSVPGA